MVKEKLPIGAGDVETKARIISAFWHRTRSTFVPLTSAEVAARVGGTAQSVGTHLAALVSAGFARSERIRGSESMLWELTVKGQRWVNTARGESNAL